MQVIIACKRKKNSKFSGVGLLVNNTPGNMKSFDSILK